jgi:hypothetical protein
LAIDEFGRPWLDNDEIERRLARFEVSKEWLVGDVYIVGAGGTL